MEFRLENCMKEDPFTISVDGIDMSLEFVHERGKGYEFFNSSELMKSQIVNSKPDIVLVILGGNGVSSKTDIPQVSAQMRLFHAWLREACPNVIIIAAECEPRYNLNLYDHLGKPVESYYLRRNAFNQALNRTKSKDFLLRTANYLNHRRFYGKNGVHFNARGNRFYWGLIIDCLSKAVDKFGLNRV